MTPYAAYLISQEILDQRRREGDRARLVREAAPKRNKKRGRNGPSSPLEVTDVSRPL